MGLTQQIEIRPGSVAAQAYGKLETMEQFFCNYGLNPVYRNQINQGDLEVTGVDHEDAVRIVELPGHPFYVATLFLPQVASTPDRPHPLIVAYLKAARAFQAKRPG